MRSRFMQAPPIRIKSTINPINPGVGKSCLIQNCNHFYHDSSKYLRKLQTPLHRIHSSKFQTPPVNKPTSTPLTPSVYHPFSLPPIPLFPPKTLPHQSPIKSVCRHLLLHIEPPVFILPIGIAPKIIIKLICMSNLQSSDLDSSLFIKLSDNILHSLSCAGHDSSSLDRGRVVAVGGCGIVGIRRGGGSSGGNRSPGLG